MFTSVFSTFLVSVAGFMTVVSFFCSGGFITVVLLSFFSAGGFVTVVSFCSQAVSSARLASMQIYFFIPNESYYSAASDAFIIEKHRSPPAHRFLLAGGEFNFASRAGFLAAHDSDAPIVCPYCA